MTTDEQNVFRSFPRSTREDAILHIIRAMNCDFTRAATLLHEAVCYGLIAHDKTTDRYRRKGSYDLSAW